MDYSLPTPESISEIGRRARRLRTLLGMTPEQVAAAASVTAEEVFALEDGADVRLGSVLAIHSVLSSDAAGADLFIRPKMRSIDEVVAFEQRRLGQ